MSDSIRGATVFGYDASMAMAWIGGIVFTIMFVIHAFQYIHYRSLYLYLLMLGVVMELCGYWTRVVAIKQPENGGASSMSYILVTIAPSFLAAACYMSFGRIMYWATPENKRGLRHTWVPIRWFTTFFVSWDMASFFITCIGVFVLIANTTKKDLTPEQQISGLEMTYRILRVAFVWQIIFFGLFSIIAIRFMLASKAWKYDWPEGGSSQWRKIAWVVNGAAILITCRSLYRCLSFTLNHGDNYLKDHEWTFYMFDFIPIVFVLILFSIVHPGKYIPSEYTTIDHAYRQPGFRPEGASKETEEHTTAAGYSRVTLVPPPLAPPLNSNRTQAPESSVNFNDPWNNRPSPGTERY